MKFTIDANTNRNYEWLFIVLIAVAIGQAVLAPLFTDIIHNLLALTGAIMLLVIIPLMARKWNEPFNIKQINPQNLLMGTAFCSALVGAPILLRIFAFTPTAPPTGVTPTVLFFGIFTEEMFRIGVYVLASMATKNNQVAAVVISGIAFAGLHLYWSPGDWVFAVVSGGMFSAEIALFGSQIAAVISHYIYDATVMGFLSPTYFVAIIIVTALLGYLLYRVRER